GPDSLVAAVSTSGAALDAVAKALADADAPTASARTCALVEVSDAEAALAFAEALAPEHLELIGAESEALAPRVRSAGCLFVGAGSATAFGDYVAGSNHVLPTGGAARFASALSPQHFRRRMAEVRIDGADTATLAWAGAAIARAEGFVAHAESMEARIRANGGDG
nr:histidinol dehydrogenase [Actinomycetota bacterium]